MVTDDQIREVSRIARKYARFKGFERYAEDFAQEAALQYFLKGDVYLRSLFVDFLRKYVGRWGQNYLKAKYDLTSIPYHEIDYDWRDSEGERTGVPAIDLTHPMMKRPVTWDAEVEILQPYIERDCKILSDTDKKILNWILKKKQQQWIAGKVGMTAPWVSVRRKFIAQKIKDHLNKKDGFDENNKVIDMRRMRGEIEYAKKNIFTICKQSADREILRSLWLDTNLEEIRSKYKLNITQFRRRKNVLLRRIREAMAKELTNP